MNRKHTIKDVAAVAGVSAMTVSRVFHGNKNVAPATVALVTEAAARLNYHPDSTARALRGCATNYIGVIASDTLWAGRVLRSISKPLRPLGYTVFYSDSLGDAKITSAALDEFAGSHMDAILLEWRQDYAPLLPKIEQFKNVVIFGFDEIPESSCDFCRIDIATPLKEALGKLCAAGKKNIWQLCPYVMRHQHIFGEFGFGDNWIDTTPFPETPDESRSHLDAFIDFSDRGGKADAIFCDNDIAAFYLCHYLRSRQIRVPEDIAVIGFGNYPMAGLATPSISTISINPRQLGDTLVRALVTRLKNGSAAGQRLTFETQFLERESSRLQ